MVDTEAAPGARLQCLQEMSLSEGRKSGWWWWAFAGLCVLAGSRWISSDEWPQTASTLSTEAWACWVAALGSFALAGLRKPGLPARASALKLVAIGAGLLAAPALGAVLSGPAAQPFNRTVALCLVPVVVAVLGGIWGEGGMGRLWPGLVGLGGAMLVFPLVVPVKVVDYVWLLVVPLAVGAASAGLARAAKGVAAEWCAAMVFTGGAVCLGLLEAVRLERTGVVAAPVTASAVGINVVIAVLTVWVFVQGEAMAYVARYFLVPLITIVEGVLIFREGVTGRLVVGVGLLAVGTGALLWSRRREGDGLGLL